MSVNWSFSWKHVEPDVCWERVCSVSADNFRGICFWETAHSRRQGCDGRAEWRDSCTEPLLCLCQDNRIHSQARAEFLDHGSPNVFRRSIQRTLEHRRLPKGLYLDCSCNTTRPSWRKCWQTTMNEMESAQKSPIALTKEGAKAFRRSTHRENSTNWANRDAAPLEKNSKYITLARNTVCQALTKDGSANHRLTA